MLFILITGIWKVGMLQGGMVESWTGFVQMLIVSLAFLVYLIGEVELSLVHLFYGEHY